MQKHDKPYYLVKVMNKKWADKLINGEVFMRAIACFGDLANRSSDSKNGFRGDTMEGFSFSFDKSVCHPYGIMPTAEQVLSGIKPIGFGLIDVLKYREKIFSLYALEYDEECSQFVKPDSRIAEFGDTAVVIHNPTQFLRRVCYAMLERFGNDFWTSFMRVEYDAEFGANKAYDEFSKNPQYSWQNEFRIVLDLAQGKFDPETLKDVTDTARLNFPGEIIEDKNPDSLADSLILNIDNISDLCFSMPIGEFIDCKNIRERIPNASYPPQIVEPLIIPRPARPTFYRLAARLP